MLFINNRDVCLVCGVCVVCVGVCLLDRLVEYLTGLPKKSFKNLDDTLCLSASIFSAAFRAVLN